MKRNRLWKLSAANALALCLIYLSDRLFAERTTFTLLIAALPPLLYLLPSLLLFLASIRNWRLAAINAVVLAMAAILIAGFRLNLPTNDQATLRIMTFNVQHGDKGIEKVAALIEQNVPEIVAIQEGSQEVELSLANLLPNYTIVRNESMIVLTKLPVIDVRTWPPVKGKRRPIQRVQLSAPNPFFLYNVHLEPSRIESHLGSGLFTHLRTWESIQSKELDDISNALVDRPLVLCGDFNRLPVGLRFERLTSRMHDAHDEAGFGFGNTIPSQIPFRRIDWILVSRHWRVLRAFVPREIASDHRPIVADLKIDGDLANE